MLRLNKTPLGKRTVLSYTWQHDVPYDLARNKAAKELLDSGAEWLLFVDSVPRETPIVIRDKLTGEVDIRPISELVTIPDGGGIQRVPVENLQTPGGRDSWVDVKAVIRHPYNGPLKRITTRSGRIDISPNHSIYKIWSGRPGLCNAKEVRVGDALAMPRVARYQGGSGERGRQILIGGERVAWLYGLFTAEGSTSGRVVSIANKNTDILQKAKDIVEDLFGWDTEIYDGGQEVNKLATSSKALSAHFSTFYDSYGQKRTPSIILNAPLRIQQSFFEGYMQGDGHKDVRGFASWVTKSPTLAAQLLYIMERMGLDSYTVHTRPDKPEIFQAKINKYSHYRDPFEVTKVEDIHYSGHVYDLATSNEKFVAGVGGFLVHNTDVIPPPQALERLLGHNLPIVGALYWRRHPKIYPEIFRFRTGTTQLDPIPETELQFHPALIEVDGIAAGFLLIHRRVFESLKDKVKKLVIPSEGTNYELYEFFKYAASDPPYVSEDLFFCIIARTANFKIYADASIECGHLSPTVMVKGGKIGWTPLETGRG